MSGCDVEKSLIMIGLSDVLSASWSQRYSSISDLCPSVRGKVFSLLAKDTYWAYFCVYRTSHLSSWHVLVDPQRSQHQWRRKCGLVDNLEAPVCKAQSLSTFLWFQFKTIKDTWIVILYTYPQMNEWGRSGKIQSGEIWFLGMIVTWAVGFLELRLISEGWIEGTKKLNMCE